MEALRYLAVVTKDVGKHTINRIKNGDKKSLLDSIDIVAYLGGTKFEAVPNDLKSYYLNLAKPLNFEISKEKGLHLLGYIDIFSTQYNIITYVILAEIYKNNALIGYSVAYRNNSGVSVKNISKADAIRLSKTYIENSYRAFHNAVYVAPTLQKSGFIKNYTNGNEFMRIDLFDKKKSPTIYRADSNALDDLDNGDQSSFSKEQLEILSNCKRNGLPVEKIANPKLSPKQMSLLIKLEKLGVDCRYFSDPKASLSGLAFYVAEAETGAGDDIMNYIYPELSGEQLFEVSLGYESGVDYDQYAKKEIYPTEMAEIRLRLESELWTCVIPSDDIISAKLRSQKNKLEGNKKEVEIIDKKLDKINSLKKEKRNL